MRASCLSYIGALQQLSLILQVLRRLWSILLLDDLSSNISSLILLSLSILVGVMVIATLVLGMVTLFLLLSTGLGVVHRLLLIENFLGSNF
jgi:hypothetical protein